MNQIDDRTGVLALKKVARFLANLTSEELEDLAAGRAAIELVQKRRAVRSRGGLDENGIENMLKKLSSLQDRDEGAAYLERSVTTRADLERVATALDLPSEKRDTVARIRQRVIEATIGYRLRSEAIQGKGRIGRQAP